MSELTLGIIGAGRVGTMHTENIVRHVPEIGIMAIADPALDEDWARGLGIEMMGRDAGAVLDSRSIDAVAIFTSTPTHSALIERAIAAGKDVFCEKPVAFDPAEIDRLAGLAEAAGVRVMVGLNRRFDPSFARVRDAVARGEVGEVQIVRITNRDPARPDPAFLKSSGGLFMDFTVHDFDMARFVSGRDIVEVSAMGAALIDPAIAEAGDIDTAIITLGFAGGALGVIDNSREAVYGYDQRVEVFGSRGSAEARNAAPTTTLLRTADGVRSDRPWGHFSTRYREAYIAELRAFVRCVRDRSPIPVGLGDMASAVRAARAAARSLAERRPVPVDSVDSV